LFILSCYLLPKALRSAGLFFVLDLEKQNMFRIFNVLKKEIVMDIIVSLILIGLFIYNPKIATKGFLTGLCEGLEKQK